MRTFVSFLFLVLTLLVTTQSVRLDRDDPAWHTFVMPYRLAKLATQAPAETLAMPVAGVRVSQVADTWGAPRPGGRSHQGQDIFAPRDTPIYAAAAGVVTRITDQTLGGNSVFVTGAGGYRYYYTHLEAFATGLYVGQPVTTDTLLGYVGNSGNARTTPTHLHFSVYTPSGAIDPLPLLTDRHEPTVVTRMVMMCGARASTTSTFKIQAPKLGRSKRSRLRRESPRRKSPRLSNMEHA